ncbi:hypothetical protein EJ02DRAFT_423260 [Clathrospora elynae]|uniref:Uncharacterized protein n=1 Tax=Clathrospora elynae TaxID=706981 RepID=A0A6A5SRC6_9PLEO|nr:hypothetical protein EJ02DRAFT_423260 [Clathrospora elynae]
MATQEQEMQVTRASVILQKPDNWSKWLFTRKISADQNSLWEYVNPDLLLETLKKLEDERPTEDAEEAPLSVNRREESSA